MVQRKAIRLVCTYSKLEETMNSGNVVSKAFSSVHHTNIISACESLCAWRVFLLNSVMAERIGMKFNENVVYTQFPQIV